MSAVVHGICRPSAAQRLPEIAATERRNRTSIVHRAEGCDAKRSVSAVSASGAACGPDFTRIAAPSERLKLTLNGLSGWCASRFAEAVGHDAKCIDCASPSVRPDEMAADLMLKTSPG